MFRHILLPTDGSRLSEQAAFAGIALARSVGARVTALHVLPRSERPRIDEWVYSDARHAYRIDAALQKRAREFLDTLRDEAMRSGVKCECRVAHGDSVSREIVGQALAQGCDLIVMASHGTRGDAVTAMGSETLRVATSAAVPVLVHQVRRGAVAGAAAAAR